MSLEARIFESHAHYDDEQFDGDREELLTGLKDSGVEYVVNIGASFAGCKQSIELAKQFPFVYATVGIHPDEVGCLDEDVFAEIKRLLLLEKVVAVGEIGLDYHWNVEEKEIQKKWFTRQLQLARELDKPVVVHSRDATEDTLEIIKSEGQGLRGVIHCFSGSAEIAREYVKLGYYIGIGGVITFKNANKLKVVVEETPLESLLLETDAPYLSPVPYRGKRNDSSKLKYVAEEIAEIKGVSYEAVLAATYQNGKELYGI